MGRDPTGLPINPQESQRSAPRAANGQRRTARAHPESGVVQPGSFAGHYGQLIISDGIAPIPRALYLYQGALHLSPQQVWFISYVLAHKWDGDLPHPRLQELARHATLGLRQIKKIKNSIVRAGLLEVSPRFGSEGEQDANSYDFGPLFDRLEQFVIADLAAPPDELAEHSAAEAARAVARGTVPAVHAVPDRSFAARYGRVVLRRGVSAIPRALFTYQAELGLSAQQLWFIGYILSFQWSTELPYPSLRKMAQNTGYSERQIHRIKDTLVSAGYLRVVERRGADGRDTSSAYDFTELLKTLTSVIRKRSTKASAQGANTGKVRGTEDEASSLVVAAPGQASYQLSLEPHQAGGEPYVSGGVNSTSVVREPGDSGRVNSISEGGVNRMSVGRVNSTSYELESIKEESDKEEHQQQPAEVSEAQEAQENAYFALVDVGVFPSTALEISQHLDPDHITGWIRYYLSVLSEQDNLSNPLGVLVSRLRSGEEAPYLPSSADLHSLRLQYSRFR